MIRVLVAVVAALAAAGCGGPGAGLGGLSGPSAGDLARLTAHPRPPVIAAGNAAEAARAGDRLAAASARLSEAGEGRRVEVAAAPWLRASPEGALFLASPPPRALARGEPLALCPAAAASPPSASPAAAAEAALADCLATLRRRGAPEECGCRVVAADDALLAPLESFVFAPAVSAFLIEKGRLLRLSAEALRPEAGAEFVSFRMPGGEVARAALEGERAAFAFMDAPERLYAGSREAFGYRRGRVAERLRLEGPAGERLTLLIGIEARDVFTD